jgi:hypothetical protein
VNQQARRPARRCRAEPTLEPTERRTRRPGDKRAAFLRRHGPRRSVASLRCSGWFLRDVGRNGRSSRCLKRRRCRFAVSRTPVNRKVAGRRHEQTRGHRRRHRAHSSVVAAGLRWIRRVFDLPPQVYTSRPPLPNPTRLRTLRICAATPYYCRRSCFGQATCPRGSDRSVYANRPAHRCAASPASYRESPRNRCRTV